MRFANRHRSGGEGSGGPSRRTGERKSRVAAHKRMQSLTSTRIERQSMGNQIDTALVAARTRFVNVHCWSFNADFHHEKTRNSGRGGIRTHGGFPHARFRVECLKPDSATLPRGEKRTPNVERPTSKIECNCLRDSAFSLDRILCLTRA